MRSDDFEISFDEGKLIVKHKDKTYETDVTLKLQEVKDIEIIETPTTDAEQENASSVSKYDKEMSDGKSFRQAFPELLRDDAIQKDIIDTASKFGYDITTGEINDLYNILVDLFQKNLTDEEINDALSNVEQINNAYQMFRVVMPNAFDEILNQCI